ncbi:MAG: hypothetical protein JST68_22590 [Bacteroidetes bacterium]|nr:hypothetical protein [Bacteroidota bacterium]
MKKLLLFALFLPFVGGSSFMRATSTITLADVRTGKWPISLEQWTGHRDTAFVLLFRDQQVMVGEVMDTLPFKNLSQLRYLDSAFSVLNNNGDLARFSDFTIKRSTTRVDGTSYLLRYKEGTTEFRQPEVAILRGTIRKL